MGEFAFWVFTSIRQDGGRVWPVWWILRVGLGEEAGQEEEMEVVKAGESPGSLRVRAAKADGEVKEKDDRVGFRFLVFGAGWRS